jgi:uncharacterized protein
MWNNIIDAENRALQLMLDFDPEVDEFCTELLSTRAMRRLEGITFLGAIDYVQPSNGNSAHQRRHNRFEHSLAVTKLVSQYCVAKELSLQSSRHLLAAALLHDVGHGPLSHTLEPIFKVAFGVDHHLMGEAHLRGQTSIGREIEKIFIKWQIDRDLVIELLWGNNGVQHSSLFCSSHNVDTLEAITRSIAMVRPSSTPRTAKNYFELLWLSNKSEIAVGDEFWRLKNDVYKLLINGMTGRLMDSVAKSYMKSRLDQFSPLDFLSSERRFSGRHRDLFSLLRSARPLSLLGQLVDKKMLQTELEFVSREFFVDGESVTFEGRYKQAKSRHTQRLDAIIESNAQVDPTQYEMSLS